MLIITALAKRTVLKLMIEAISLLFDVMLCALTALQRIMQVKDISVFIPSKDIIQRTLQN